jgi:hypothetical protein
LKIFIGSSKEGRDQAEKIAADLSEIDGIDPLPWYEAFKTGDLTLERIEKIVGSVAGAVLLCTPDDDLIIRDKQLKTSRANVLLEYAFLMGRLSRHRVALCKYDNVEMPSNLQGLAYIEMGLFQKGNPLAYRSRAELKEWVHALPKVKKDVSATTLLHGYSGIWTSQTIFERWRDKKITGDDLAKFFGHMILQIPINESKGFGCIYGDLTVRLDGDLAKFSILDEIHDVRVEKTGDLSFHSTLKFRRRIHPLKDKTGKFDEEVTGTDIFISHFPYLPDNSGPLKGTYISDKAGKRCSIGSKEIWR